jgi:hypothetical protein
VKAYKDISYGVKERNFLLENIVVGFIKQNLLRVNQKDL